MHWQYLMKVFKIIFNYFLEISYPSRPNVCVMTLFWQCPHVSLYLSVRYPPVSMYILLTSIDSITSPAVWNLVVRSVQKNSKEERYDSWFVNMGHMQCIEYIFVCFSVWSNYISPEWTLKAIFSWVTRMFMSEMNVNHLPKETYFLFILGLTIFLSQKTMPPCFIRMSRLYDVVNYVTGGLSSKDLIYRRYFKL